MALIVEDGTGVAAAESYCDVATADTYHANRGNAAWTALTLAVKEQSLRRATDYMQQMYLSRWRGWRKTVGQRLEWPRLGVQKAGNYPYPSYVSDTIVPDDVKNACAELALRASTVALAPDLDRAKASVTIGPLSVTYDPASPESKRFRAVEAILKQFFCDGGNSVRLARV